MILTKRTHSFLRAPGAAEPPVKAGSAARGMARGTSKPSRTAPDFDKIGADICRRYPKLLKELADH
jgi:hypothetical protein